MATVLPLCLGCLNRDKQTQLYHNHHQVVVNEESEKKTAQFDKTENKISSGWFLSNLQPLHHSLVKAAQTSSLNIDFFCSDQIK